MTFNPSEHLVKIKTKQGMQDYLKVQHRLVWFRQECAEGIVETEMVHLDTEKQIAVFKAIVHNGGGALATGHGSESARDFMDYIEKAETKAIGRALAALGFGTQFTADELDEGERIADAPVAQGKAKLQVVPQSDDGTEERLAQVKALFHTLYKPDRWEPYKVHTLGLPVADEGLSLTELDKLYSALVDVKKAAKEA
jgi:hypothetical protein